MEQFELVIVTPDRDFYRGKVQAAIVETPAGQREILPHTLPSVFILSGGIMRIRQNDRWMEAVSGEGFVRVGKNDTVVMASTCEWPHEIDADAVNEQIEELDDRMKKAQSMREYKLAKAQLAIQLAKLNSKNRGQ